MKITTAGDVDRARGDKSRWVGALEAALLAGEIDLAVHSAKDVPGRAAPRGRRSSRRRGAPSRSTCSSARTRWRVREGARVGTSALRRRAQLLAARPDLEVVRAARERRHAAGQARRPARSTCSVLAAAGLDRLGRRAEAGALLTGGVFVAGAAGQGVVAVQARIGSEAAAPRPRSPTTRGRTPRSTRSAASCARSARAATRRSACSPPSGRVRAFVGLPDGSEWLVDEAATGDELAAADARGGR